MYIFSQYIFYIILSLTKNKLYMWITEFIVSNNYLYYFIRINFIAYCMFFDNESKHNSINLSIFYYFLTIAIAFRKIGMST